MSQTSSGRRCHLIATLLLSFWAPAWAVDVPPDASSNVGSLEGSEWVLYEVLDHEGAVIAPFAEMQEASRSIVRIRFTREMVKFSGACHRFMAPYRFGGRNLATGIFYQTIDKCSEKKRGKRRLY